MFSRTLLDVQRDITKKRGDRSAAKKQTLISHPHVAAKRRIQQAQAKKNAKRARKMNLDWRKILVIVVDIKRFFLLQNFVKEKWGLSRRIVTFVASLLNTIVQGEVIFNGI